MEAQAKNVVTVYAVIVNWNGIKDTGTCLDSLAKTVRAKTALHVVVVDNGSTDNSISVLRSKYPWVTVLQMDKNLGFTGGNNAGIRYALSRHADFIWILNNDTFVDKGVLSMVRTCKDRTVGICGSKIYFAPGHEFHLDRYKEGERGRVIWFAGGIIDWNNMMASHRGVDETDHGQYNKREDTPFITGCSMLIRSDVFEKIGEFDDRYFLYLEDLDFCIRARRAGFRLVYEPSSVLWHVNAGSSARPGNALHEYYITRNRLLLGFRYAPLRTRWALIREALRFILYGSQVRRKAVIDALLGRYGNQFTLKA